MNFSGLKRLIESADQNSFYDVALLQLTQLGYGDLHVVDGPNDGGKDVESNRKHVQIQLSVRKDWEKKIKEEAKNALEASKRHLLFLTNRHITQNAEANFRRGFADKTKIDLTIYDSSRIATNLSAPGKIAKSYQLLGVEIRPLNKFSVSDIAASVALLFGDESLELREKTIDSVVMAWLRHHNGVTEDRLIGAASDLIPGANPPRLVATAVSRLRTKGSIVGPKNAVSLSEAGKAKVDSAESELMGARGADIKILSETFELPRSIAEKLLDIAIELTIRSNRAGWSAAIGDDLKGFLAEHGLAGQTNKVNRAISELSIVNKYQYVSTIDQLFSTNTFDIFRALGGQTDISIVLDTSVALPLMFGLEFERGISGYSSASFAMKQVADSHGFSLVLPRPYLNEMASHGHRALEFLDVYQTFEPELRSVMRSSSNAYISHYAAISERAADAGDRSLTFAQFLAHFGIKRGGSIGNAERVIEGILEAHQIPVVWDNRFDSELRDEIAHRKKYDPDVVIRHDAAVCSHLIKNVDKGFIFATWDRILIDILLGKLRVYAQNPGRIVDWLSFAQGMETGIDGSVEVFSALAIIDEGDTTKLAEKLALIRDTQEAYKLNSIIREARSKVHEETLSSDEVARIVEAELVLPAPANDDGSDSNLPSVPER